MSDTYYLYVLIKDGKAVYVGITNNVSRRILKHKLEKDFTNHRVLKVYKSKELALNAENAIIRFLSYFGEDYVLNGKHMDLSIMKEFDGGLD